MYANINVHIAGRAGRYGSQYPVGHYGVMRSQADLMMVKDLVNSPVEMLSRAGVMPTFENVRDVALLHPGRLKFCVLWPRRICRRDVVFVLRHAAASNFGVVFCCA